MEEGLRRRTGKLKLYVERRLRGLQEGNCGDGWLLREALESDSVCIDDEWCPVHIPFIYLVPPLQTPEPHLHISIS